MVLARSRRSNLFVMKVWASLIWLLVAALWLRDTPVDWRDLLAVPLLILSFFHASLAEIEVQDGSFRYRRFLKWKAICCEEISSSGAVWKPFIGYVRVNHFLWPWGRLYFVLDPNLESNPFRSGNYPVLRWLKEHQRESDDSGGAKASAEKFSNPPAYKIRLFAAGAIGVAVSFARIALARAFPQQSPGCGIRGM
jgi:hypothetical protein